MMSVEEEKILTEAVHRFRELIAQNNSFQFPTLIRNDYRKLREILSKPGKKDAKAKKNRGKPSGKINNGSGSGSCAIPEYLYVTQDLPSLRSGLLHKDTNPGRHKVLVYSKGNNCDVSSRRLKNGTDLARRIRVYQIELTRRRYRARLCKSIAYPTLKQAAEELWDGQPYALQKGRLSVEFLNPTKAVKCVARAVHKLGARKNSAASRKSIYRVEDHGDVIRLVKRRRRWPCRFKIAKNQGGIPGAAGHILSHETSAASSAMAHMQQSQRERTSTGRPKIESKSERGAAGFGPRQRRIKVCGADGKMRNIDAMEYNTRNITHLEREPARGG
ncbi:hypothetical protein B0H19DRAFT_1077966 [Mycena capillaripes]|nr:hypothetical protein B0H19DRAFT_1077966 [Mycena capillaripes]